MKVSTGGNKKKRMASNSEKETQLTNYQKVRLGQVITGTDMESIALGYLDIDEEEIKQTREERGRDQQGFVRDLITKWANRHKENQVQV